MPLRKRGRVIFAIIAALVFGIYVGASISFRSQVDEEIRKRMNTGPLRELSARTLRLHHAAAACRGRGFAMSIVQKRLRELDVRDPNFPVVALELTNVLAVIATTKSPVEIDLDRPEMPKP